ncbi:L-lactate dehydrogenase complex protein LldG [Polaribacter sp. KT25b]|uniref:LutC/YkgG family protein n=1 Tax=Polaribacter sp. KT25b TaxID=1855336 RepID=UPI00087C957A|nr:LUD domain-containing protein [Polaribacter sp. KT25b]SDR65511.1 L-lactate dehydrogenase complex protein LldG [Polaribacter sp. KT25b]
MGSRNQILDRIKANKPSLLSLPNINSALFHEDLDLLKEFTKKVEVVGGNVLNANSNEDIMLQIEKIFPDTKVKFSSLENSQSFNTIDLASLQKPHDLENLDLLILESKLAVAENGAIWMSDDEIPVRVLPFIAQHLVLVLSAKNIVPYMHQAYDQLNNFGFGVFIAGPSKTADIEQSLVIGAHGALSLTVFLKE